MEVQNEPKNEPKITNNAISRTIIGLGEIGNLDIEDFKLNYGITRSIANLSQVEKAYIKSLNAIQKKYISKDEKGNFVIEGNNYVFNSEKEKSSYLDELDKLNETVVDVEVWKMKTSDLQKLKGIKGTTMSKCHEIIIDDLNLK